MITPVLLAGGSGTRLWPLSRELYPKQFLPLTGEHSLLQATVERLRGLPLADLITVCGEDHRFVVAEQLRATGQASTRILLEPLGRDTACGSENCRLSQLVITSIASTSFIRGHLNL